MKKLILFFLLFPFFVLAQVSTGQETPFETGIQNLSTQTVTSPTYIVTQGNDGTYGKVTPGNLLTQTTAGTFARVNFTGDVSVVNAVNYYATSTTSKGSTASVAQTVSPDDNQKLYFAQDYISILQPSLVIYPIGNYSGQFAVQVANNSVQQKFYIEIYKTNNLGVPIASGVSGAPVGSLGVTLITTLESGLVSLTGSTLTNITLTGTLTGPLTVNPNERIKYHIAAEKVGTAGGTISMQIFSGTNYNSYYDVPVPVTTDGVVNKVPGLGNTSTDALTFLNTNKANDSDVIHKTLNETKSGTLGVLGAIFNTNASAPSASDGAMYKLTQSTTSGQSWSTTYTPVFSRYNSLTDYVKNKPASFRKKVMIYGSSVALGEGSTGGNTGWAQKLATELTSRGFTVKNHSIPANATVDLINRFYTDVVPENPDFLVISLGLGNEGLVAGDKEAVYNSFKTGLQKLIFMCRQQGIIPILGNSYSNNNYTATDYNYVKQINSELDSWGVPVFDFLGADNDLTGKWISGSFADALHPNDIGHQAFYKSIPPSMFDALVDYDYKKLKPSSGAIKIGTEASLENPIQGIIDGAIESFTFAMWFKVDDSAGYGKAFVGFGTGASRIRNPNAVDVPPIDGLRYTTNSGTDLAMGSSVKPEITNRWYHIAVVYSSITQTSRVYLDGVFQGEVADVISLSTLTIAGRSPSGFASLNAVNTNFKDILLYRSRLTDGQIKQLYNGDIIKSSLEIYSPMGDKNISVNYRILNLAPTKSYLKFNSTAFSAVDQAVLSVNGLSKNITDTGTGVNVASPLNIIGTLSVKKITSSPYPTLGVASGSFSNLGDTGLFGLYSGVSSSGTSWLQSMRNDAATSYSLVLQPSGGDVYAGNDSNAGNRLVRQSELSSVIPYKSYRALISQTGTSAPVVVNVYENTLGFTPTWTRTSVGTFSASGTFVSNKTHVLFQFSSYTTGNAYTSAANVGSAVTLITASNGSLTDGISGYVEIKVYP